MQRSGTRPLETAATIDTRSGAIFRVFFSFCIMSHEFTMHFPVVVYITVYTFLTGASRSKKKCSKTKIISGMRINCLCKTKKTFPLAKLSQTPNFRVTSVQSLGQWKDSKIGNQNSCSLIGDEKTRRKSPRQNFVGCVVPELRALEGYSQWAKRAIVRVFRRSHWLRTSNPCNSRTTDRRDFYPETMSDQFFFANTILQFLSQIFQRISIYNIYMVDSWLKQSRSDVFREIFIEK